LNSNDDSQALLERINDACRQKLPLHIVGGDSKRHLGEPVSISNSESLSTLNHSGIISYEPTELVVSVRAGTSMTELVNTLSSEGQMLPFEPPLYPNSTIGGVLACGLSGARRPFTGSARDYVLGMRIINGQAQNLSFGGEVMKNVAGYDVSRLQVGAWGTLGLLLDTSMKVLPKPELEVTLRQEWKTGGGGAFAPLLRRPIPLSGAMLIDGACFLRLSGSESAVKAAASDLGGEQLDDADSLWSSVAEQTHEFFNTDSSDHASGKTIWRISVADHVPQINLAGTCLYDWAGAQRWFVTEEKADTVFAASAAVSGHATRYSPAGTSNSEPSFQPLSGPLQRLQMRVRDSFDPNRLFNRGRFHPEFDEIEEAHGTAQS